MKATSDTQMIRLEVSVSSRLSLMDEGHCLLAAETTLTSIHMNHRRNNYPNPPSLFQRGALFLDGVCHAVPERPKAFGYGCILRKSSIKTRLKWHPIACGSNFLSHQLAPVVQNVSYTLLADGMEA